MGIVHRIKHIFRPSSEKKAEALMERFDEIAQDVSRKIAAKRGMVLLSQGRLMSAEDLQKKSRDADRSMNFLNRVFG